MTSRIEVACRDAADAMAPIVHMTQDELQWLLEGIQAIDEQAPATVFDTLMRALAALDMQSMGRFAPWRDDGHDAD